MNLSRAIEIHLEEERCRHLAESTIIQKKQRLLRFAEWSQSRNLDDPRDVSRQTLFDYHRMLQELKRTDGKPLHAHTINLSMQIVLRFFKRLAARDLILEDITIDFPRLKHPVTLPRGVPTRVQVMKLLQQPNMSTPLGFRDRTMIEVLYSTGIRGGELCRLLLHDLNLSGRMIRILQGKGHKDRVVPIGKVAAGYLAEYIRRVRPVLVGEEGCNAAFLSANGHALDPKNLLRIFKAYRDKAGLPDDITTHGLRHACATEMLKGGASIRHIQEMLGHAHITTTQIYTRIVPVELQKAHARTAPSERRKTPEAVRFDPSRAHWKDMNNAQHWEMFKKQAKKPKK